MTKRKDDDGLTLSMKIVLQELAVEPNFRRACVKADVPLGTVRSWLQTEEAFQAHYDNLLKPGNELIRQLMESTALRATAMYDEAVYATDIKDVEVQCPCECGHVFTTEVAVANWGARLKAGETAMKIARVLKDVREQTNLNTDVTIEELVAKLRAERELSVPSDMAARLKEKGALDAPHTTALVPVS